MKRPHVVESEIGVSTVTIYGNAVSELKPCQHLLSFSFEEIMVSLAQAESYRKATERLNRLLHRGNEAQAHATTTKDRIVSLGKKLGDSYAAQAHDILELYGIDPNTGIVDDGNALPIPALQPKLPQTASLKSQEDVIAGINKERSDAEMVKDPEKVSSIELSGDDCVYVSVDDIGVKHQKDSRGAASAKDRKYIENTVIHVQHQGSAYYITAVGMRQAFILLMAYLLNNHLLEDKRLIFFSDGATNIKDHICEFFSFREYTLILDWLHLKKKCKEFLSMGVKGKKDERNEIRKQLLRILWAGNTDDAIRYLKDIKARNIKNQDKLDELVGYLTRKKDYIACYALRSRINLRISSNRVEKANDIIVASRQKHNGMSWSNDGSGALAIITSADANGEWHDWIRGKGHLLENVA